jgi:hypothetical protein
MAVTLELPTGSAPKAEATVTQETSKPTIKENINEDAFWAAAAEEVGTGSINQGLWTRLLVHHDGDEAKAKLAYLKARVATMKAEAISEAS